MNYIQKLISFRNFIKVYNKPKVFGIGNNKTGTTSLKVAMRDLGYIVGRQQEAEEMLGQWAKRDFKQLVKYCRCAEFFQDAPFSKPFTFVVLDHEFPNSKFILTVRNNAEQWYDSLTTYHAKKWGKDGRIPTKEDLTNATYIYKGMPWEANRWFYPTPEDTPYKKDILIKGYEQYNENVKEYFRHRPKDLLVLNVAENGAFMKLCNFLGHTTEKENFPWENKTLEIKNS